ncbi:MAG: hypothetical protein WCL29_00990, partial [Pseudomonadota bacterium]
SCMKHTATQHICRTVRDKTRENAYQTRTSVVKQRYRMITMRLDDLAAICAKRGRAKLSKMAGDLPDFAAAETRTTPTESFVLPNSPAACRPVEEIA